MIKETCSCGASFEADGPKAEARVTAWRAPHLHPWPAVNIPSVWYPATYPNYPTATYTTYGNGYIAPQTMCVSEVAS